MIKNINDNKKYYLSAVDIFLILLHIVLIYYIPFIINYILNTATQEDYTSYFVLIELIGHSIALFGLFVNLAHIILLNISEYKEVKYYNMDKNAICFNEINDKKKINKHYIDKQFLTDEIIKNAN